MMFCCCYPNGEQNWFVAGASPDILRVEGGVGLAQERRLQDVATQTIWQEPALVEVHLLTKSLEIQSDWKNTPESEMSLGKSDVLQ